ncbi:nucleoid occlusion factor SlmA [Oxalobacter aliiformigenes]|jgi:TetR/AcrR family transcriptional regulator|uniref:Nucleoid occlusion factor SlmA n=1 Tax=Oxalobacter aliiformigenes TaxID=2946593 RepID=A0A9E9NSE5_9BURK|nr:nucleoid occlusion factor SlmA [Oxalobacter aliiformigenes]MCZ4064826.1 nucleoid occlusion factor SlmA [Oxalobacter aliiformigenes]WAV89477.1 nucleoid occlusion factor SlmA [Oxalobacter aliiformigenes]WAV91485.1 nucleoid occlusion factor SlmA [Oxalobacter aliiformigenes]WAV98940.1 nucleoid occlusion factor SlmA [Oxalobacter aliiformigenes]
MGTTRSGERKLQILQALAQMLEEPRGEKITTAALARRLSISEAALYRHFASKAQMFEGLIEFIESSVFGVINQINEKEENGLLQTQSVSMLLLNFAARNPGMTRVMIGDALVNEDGRLQLRMNQFFDRVELTLRQCLRLAVVQGQTKEEWVTVKSNLMMSYIIGKLFRFVKTQFKENPTGGMQEQINFILS